MPDSNPGLAGSSHRHSVSVSRQIDAPAACRIPIRTVSRRAIEALVANLDRNALHAD